MKHRRMLLALGLLAILMASAYSQIQGARICHICSPPNGPYEYWEDCAHGRGANIGTITPPPTIRKQPLAFYQKEAERLYSEVWEISGPLTLRLERLYACKANYEKAIREHPNHPQFKKGLNDINGFIRDHLDSMNRAREQLIQKRQSLADASNRVARMLGNIQAFSDDEWKARDASDSPFMGLEDTPVTPSKPADRVKAQLLANLRPRNNDVPLVVDPLVVAGKMKAPEARTFRIKQANSAMQHYRTAFIRGDLDEALGHIDFAVSQTPWDSKLRTEHMMARLLKQGKRVSGAKIERVPVLLDALEMHKNDWLKSCAYLRHLEFAAKSRQEKIQVKEAFMFMLGAATEVMAIDDYANLPAFMSPMLDLPDEKDPAALFDTSEKPLSESLVDWIIEDFEAQMDEEQFEEVVTVLEKANDLFYVQQDTFAAIELLEQSLQRVWYEDNEDAIRTAMRMKQGICLGRDYLRETNRIKQYQSPRESP